MMLRSLHSHLDQRKSLFEQSKANEEKDDSAIIMNAREIKKANMEKYLEHRKRVHEEGVMQSQILDKGTPCEIDELGLPIGNKCDQFDENG